MKVQEIKTGMKVVATHLPNATVYTVKDVNKFTVSLGYTALNGQELDAGILDVCFLNRPTKEQLANA
jgi:hypothetical protein